MQVYEKKKKEEVLAWISIAYNVALLKHFAACHAKLIERHENKLMQTPPKYLLTPSEILYL